MQQVKMGVIGDVRDEFGNWKKTVWFDNMQWFTLSYKRWLHISERCKYGGAYQNRRPSYTGCTNEFESFQEFVEWSRKQVGYDLEGYQLDKDLLLKGNKVYSPETCIFLPSRINLLLIKRNSKRGNFPIGVCLYKNIGRFKSQCNNGSGRQVYLGSFNTPEEAFYAYKEFKENLIKQVAEEYKDVIDIRAYNALKSYKVEITD